MMGVTIQKEFKLLGPRFNRAVVPSLERAIKVIHRSVRENTPVDKGDLQESIKWDVQRKPLVGATGEVYTNSEYAYYVEYGTGIYAESGAGRKTPWVYYKDGKFYYTHGQRPQSYMRKGFDESINKATQEFSYQMKRELKKKK